MTDQSPPPSVPTEPQQEPAGKPEFAPYDLPAGGWGALEELDEPIAYRSPVVLDRRAPW